MASSYLVNSKFEISLENSKKALQALKDLFNSTAVTNPAYPSASKEPFLRCNKKDILESENLAQALYNLGWIADGQFGTYIRLEYTNARKHIFNVPIIGIRPRHRRCWSFEDLLFLNTIAPFIEYGSYLEFQANDATRFKMVLKEQQYIEIKQVAVTFIYQDGSATNEPVNL